MSSKERRAINANIIEQRKLFEPRSAIDKKRIRKVNLEHKIYKFVLISFTRILARAIATKRGEDLHIE